MDAAYVEVHETEPFSLRLHDNKNQAPGNIGVSVTSVAGTKECRICLQSDDQDDMIAPCLCSGSSKYVHRSCLDRWRITREVNIIHIKTL